MALTPNKVHIKLSDVILHENDSSTAVTRDKANVTPPTPAAPVKCGTLVFRVKSLDRTAAWTILTDTNDLVANAATGNTEVAVFLGDAFSYESETTLQAIEAGQPNAVVLARDAVVASWVLEKVNVGIIATIEKAYAQLQEAGILVEKTYGVAPSV